MAVLLLKRGKRGIFVINIRNKEGRYMLASMRRGAFLIPINVYILYLINAEIIYFVFRDIKIRHFMRSLRIIGFKTNAPYTTMYFRCITRKYLIGYFA